MDVAAQEHTSNCVKISVIIPVYNVSAYLCECVDSVLGQTLQELEIILINDGSTDGSGKICEDYAAHQPRVQVLHKENAGVGMARNDGIRMAIGEYITFVDSDDYLDANMYELLYRRVSQERADFCSCGFNRVSNGKTLITYVSGENAVYKSKEELADIFLRFLGPAPDAPNDKVVIGSSTCTCLFSLALIRQHHICFRSEREIISEDALFKMQYLCFSSRICLVNEAPYHYRVTSHSLSQTYVETRMLKGEELYREQLRILGEHTTLYEQGKPRIQRTFLMNTRACAKRCCACASSYREARVGLIAMMSSQELKLVLQEYPWARNPFKYRIFYYCLQYHLPWLLYQICRTSSYFTFGIPAFKR